MVLTESALVEAEHTCRFLRELSRYRRQWRMQLPHALNALMVRTLREGGLICGNVVHSGEMWYTQGNMLHREMWLSLGNVHAGKCGTPREMWYTQEDMVYTEM